MNAKRNTQYKCINDIVMIIDSNCKFENNSSTAFDDDSNNNSTITYENDSKDDSSLVYHTDNNDCDTDDDCNAEAKKT